MQAIGYKEAARFLRGQCGRAEAVEEIKRASRRYAKRQLTWLRRDGGLRWIVWKGTPDVEAAADAAAAEWNASARA
jgi:tRNA dimethylallyltransferase